MGLETATYINQLNINNPDDVTDYVSGGDDHLRLIKKTIQNTFPYITGPIVATQDDLTKTKYLVDTGTTNQVIVSPAIAWTSYDAGKGFIVKIAATNTGAATAKVSALAPVAILDSTGVALQDGSLIAGSIHSLIYDGTNFRLQASNGVVSNTTLKITSANSTNASIVNTKAGTLSIGTNGNTGIVINTTGNLTLANTTIPTLTVTDINVSGTITVPTINSSGTISTTGASITIQNANPALNLRDTNHRSASLYADSGHFYVLRADGINSVTSQLPVSGYWGIDHDIDLGKTTFGNDVTVKGDVIIHRLSDQTRGRIVLGNAGTKYFEYSNNYYWTGGAHNLVVAGKYVVKKNDEYFADDYYVPKFLGQMTNLGTTPTWVGSTNGSVPIMIRQSTGTFSIQFPGLTTIYSINLLGADATSKALVAVTNISTNTIIFNVHNTGGTLFNPDIGVFVQVYGA